MIELAEDAGVPVLVHAESGSVAGAIEDYLFPIYRYYQRLSRRRRPLRGGETTDAETPDDDAPDARATDS